MRITAEAKKRRLSSFRMVASDWQFPKTAFLGKASVDDGDFLLRMSLLTLFLSEP